MPQIRRIALLLALATLALYLPVAWSGFCIYDDSLYVTENPTVQQGFTWAGVKWAFTTLAASNWHPLTWLSHMADCTAFGLNPAGPHLENTLIHAVNTALLFVLLLQLLAAGRWGERPREPDIAGPSGSRGRSPHQAIWPCAFIAALFAWHPMHVESVAWISERKDVLSTFFALLTFLAYAKYFELSKVQSPKSKLFYIVSLICFALGLMAKPMLVTLPCVLLLLDFWPLGRFPVSNFEFRAFFRLCVEKIPFFAITAASCFITFISQSQQSAKAVVSLGIVPLHYRLKNVPVAYLEYLWKTFWPSKLAFFYPLPDRIAVAQAIAAVVVLLALTLIVLRLYRTRSYLATGWFWFLGMLVPVIGLVQVGGAQIADRYSYLPSVGIFIAVTFLALDAAERWRISKKVLGAIAIVILLANVATMELQLRHWRSNVALFQHALEVTTDNDVARNNLGVALEREGHLAEAAEQYRAAAKLEPDRYQGHHNLASALDRLGRHDEALASHRAAVKLGPDVQFLHHCLALALLTAGQPDEARKEFAAAARLDAHYPWPYLELAKMDLAQGRDAEAVEELRAAVRSAPENVDVLRYTALVLAADENTDARDGRNAFVLAAKANMLTGGTHAEVLDTLGIACAELGKFDEAQLAAQQALDLAKAQKLTEIGPIEQRLALYKNHQPWRESFRVTNAPAKN